MSADSATVARAAARIDHLEGAYGVLMNWFAIVASLLKLLNGLDAGQREQVRKHWADWTAELRDLQAG